LQFAGGTTTFGHDLFTAYLQHRVGIVVGARHVDVTVQLTFFEDGSEHERAHLDTSGDGRISRAEIERYEQDAETTLAQAVKLHMGGQLLELAPLCMPKLDLLGNNNVGRGHHQLTLRLFAPTLPSLQTGTELVVEDRLWPEMRALGSVHVEGRDGCRLEAEPPSDPLHPPARDGEAREFRARVVTPPTSRVGERLSPPAKSLHQPVGRLGRESVLRCSSVLFISQRP
jgi:hypothetical protein